MTEQQKSEVKILLVEDDDGDAKAFHRAFQSARIANDIVRATDGLQALGILKKQGKSKLTKPYIIFVDLNMPLMNGLELITAIREDFALKHSIIFVLTTSKSDQDKFDAYDMNIAGYIQKEKAGQDFMRLTQMIECYWRIVEIPL